MTTTTHARIAGATFLLYIAIGLTSMYLSTAMVSGAETTQLKLAGIVENKFLAQLNIICTLLAALCALVLAITIYRLTEDIDRELAIMALCCRVAEAVVIVIATMILVATISIADTVTGTPMGDPAFLAIAEVIFKIEGHTGLLAGVCFALGSTVYCYLFLITRRLPNWMASLGLSSSIILVVLLPLQIAGFVRGLIVTIMWLPMLGFELVFAFWLLTRNSESRAIVRHTAP
jgi:hypothetical protein